MTYSWKLLSPPFGNHFNRVDFYRPRYRVTAYTQGKSSRGCCALFQDGAFFGATLLQPMAGSFPAAPKTLPKDAPATVGIHVKTLKHSPVDVKNSLNPVAMTRPTMDCRKT